MSVVIDFRVAASRLQKSKKNTVKIKPVIPICIDPRCIEERRVYRLVLEKITDALLELPSLCRCFFLPLASICEAADLLMEFVSLNSG